MGAGAKARKRDPALVWQKMQMTVRELSAAYGGCLRRQELAECEDGLALYYRDYAGPDGYSGPPVLCMHGLTRNSRDFADLAEHLAHRSARDRA